MEVEGTGFVTSYQNKHFQAEQFIAVFPLGKPWVWIIGGWKYYSETA